jgi:hypothetical protein
MNEHEKREFAQMVALQALYFAGQQRNGRFLDAAEMRQAQEDAAVFLDRFFGPIPQEPDRSALDLRVSQLEQELRIACNDRQRYGKEANEFEDRLRDANTTIAQLQERLDQITQLAALDKASSAV